MWLQAHLVLRHGCWLICFGYKIIHEAEVVSQFGLIIFRKFNGWFVSREQFFTEITLIQFVICVGLANV
jgi:hypothetical protein